MEKTSVIALDPSSRRIFRYNLSSNTYKFEQNVSDSEKDKIDKELRILEKLLGLDISNWNFLSESAYIYRRRAIWYYLLQEECSEYPVFISSKELSSAYADITDIKLVIDLSSAIYNSKFPSKYENETSLEERNSIEFNKSQKTVTIKVSLVFSVGQTIKYMKEQVKKEYGINLKTRNDNNVFVFKAYARKEYLYGNAPLLAFRHVRDALRGMEFVMLKLEEIPKKIEKNFPNFVDDLEKVPKLNNFLMFYAPNPNLSETLKPTMLKPRIFHLNSTNPSLERKKNTETLLKGLETSPNFFSGECDWPFRVKVCGVEGLINIFHEAFRGNATKNGHDHPEYVVLPEDPEKKPEKKNTVKSNSKKKKKLSQSERRSSITMFKFKNRKVSKSSSCSWHYTNFMNHGPSSTMPFDLATDYRLPFVPFLLSFDAMLIYGDEIVKDSLVRSESSPFNFNARFMEWVVFPIKISKLPKETRLGIDIYVVSRNGESCLVGCVVSPLFNEFGELKKGTHALQLWPFYRVEKRIASMQEFNGISTSYSGNCEMRSSFDYVMDSAKIYVQYENFTADTVTWSLKDENYYKSLYKSVVSSQKKPVFIKNILSKRASNCKKIYKVDKIVGNTLQNYDPDEEQDLKLLRTKPQLDDLANLEKALLTDPLESLSESQKNLLFLCRDHYRTIPSGLALFLRSVDWTSPLQVSEALKLLENWSRILPEDAISLLNPEYADENVRLFACRKISQIPDDDFVLYMPQLTQALSFEIFHYSSLGELLIERALKCPHYVGHNLFWALRSQLYVKVTAERFGLILEQFLMLCGGYRENLLNEIHYVEIISDLGTRTISKEGYQEREKHLKIMICENLDRIPKTCNLPIDASMEILEPIVEECKIMNSKKMPLWITSKNSDFDAEPLEFIFKVGDDLRQDILTLQMIRVMDTIWLENGLDLRMKPYRVVVTGDQSGIIEVVPNSDTTADIQMKYGGKFGALRKGTIKQFLQDHNPEENQLEKALDNFIRSCAGYCVASYILGIADRHNGNIMITRTGHLFHIDFGHFLGNFKVKFGIQRERSNFVLTEEMAFAMGGKNNEGFGAFKSYCSKAYNLIRKHGKRLISLFMLMTSAGMPELQDKKEIEYIREMLSLKLTETEAIEKFNQEIDIALRNTFRRIDNLIHNLRRH